MGLKEKDIKNYIKKAQERLAKEKLTAQSQIGTSVVKDSEKSLVKVAKSNGRTTIEGVHLSSIPIAAPLINMVLGTSSEVSKETEKGIEGTAEETFNPTKRPIVEANSSPKKKMKNSEGEVCWTEFLQDFEGCGEITSLWDRRFPLKHFVREHITTVDDGDRIRSLGVEQACLAMQSYALKSAALGHVVCDEVNKLRSRERQGKKDAEEAKKAIAAHAELISENKMLNAKLAEQANMFEETKEFVRKQLDETESQWTIKIEEIRTTLESQKTKVASQEATISELKMSLSKAKDEMNNLRTSKEAEIEELHIENAVALLKGFGKAKDQIQALYPALDVSELDPLKEVVDGKLVMVQSPEEDDAEMKESS